MRKSECTFKLLEPMTSSTPAKAPFIELSGQRWVLTEYAHMSDAPAYTGTGSTFSAPGWKAGDKTGWEQHLKARQQSSQNDYSKMN